jgi:hypothetical protein
MNLLEPTNHRISNSLFDAINKVRNGDTAQPQQLEESNSVDKAHFCATHVEHALLGKGTCISEQHAEPDENGNIAWYSVEFPTGIQRVDSSNLKIVEGKSHSHSKKMAEEEEENEKETVKEALSGNQHKIDANKNNKIDAHDFKLLRAKKKPVEEGNDGNLANNAKPYDKVTHGDVITGRLGKDEMGGKKKKVAEARSTGTAFDMSTPSQIKKKPGELTGHSMKKSEAGGRIYTKTASKMMPDPKKKAMKEGISQTVINHNDFVLEVTDNPTYGDYLKALQSMINNNEETIQQEIVTIAQEAYNNKIESVIIEASSRATFKTKLQELRSSGAKVLDENYIVESGEPYVEYVVEQDGVRTQYVHSGTVKKV